MAYETGRADLRTAEEQGSDAGRSRRPTRGPQDSVRFDALRRALAESRAQGRTAQFRIDSLVQRISRLEKELVALAHSEQQARHLAYHDALTGLANRALLQDRLGQAISQAHRGHRLVALLLLDLDGFKRINDGLGHAAGDQLLQAVAARLSTGIRVSDTACRHGGDEFVIMLPEVDDPAMAHAVVAKARAHLSEPHIIDGHEIRITASIGIALYPAHGASYEQLMKHADIAMYLAKAASCAATIEALPALGQPFKHLEAQDPARTREGSERIAVMPLTQRDRA